MFYNSSIKQSPKVVLDSERLQKLAAELVELSDDQSAQLQGGDKWDREELSTLRRLQEEFAAELATLRGKS